MRARLLLGVVALLGLAVPATAAAHDPGVRVDPKSPAGKEYAIPLDSARDEANGGSGRSPGGSSSSSSSATGGGTAGRRAGSGRGDALFGAGISRKGAKERRAAGGKRGPGRTRVAAAASPADGSSPALPLTALALAVLAVGGLTALGVRRLGR